MNAVCPVCGASQSQSLLCSGCCDRLERDLGDVAAIVHELDVTISKQAKIGNASGPGGLARERTPVNWGAAQVADDLQNTLTTWARDVEGPTFRTFSTDSDRDATAYAARILLNRIDAIRRHPAVEELVDEITDAITQARRVVDRPADKRYLGRCDTEFEGVTCTEELYAKPGAVEVACRTCGITHDVHDRRSVMLDEARDMLFAVKDASTLIGELAGIRITEDSIRGYLRRGRIAYRPGNTIRLGDLWDVVIDDAERKTA